MGKRENYSAKQTTLNIISQATTFLINMAIGFFLTPYIASHFEYGANGFVQLSSSFISYATLITSAINSMAGRFIAVSYFKKDEENVLKYYSSVMIANIFLVVLLYVENVVMVVQVYQELEVLDQIIYLRQYMNVLCIENMEVKDVVITT